MKIYDCFTFYQEFELLDIRMTLLDSVVDYFVIVEANKTQKGEDKSFNFEKRKDEFAKWKDKIIYVKADAAPDCTGNDDWSIENYQRNSIADGLTKCDEDDLIIISDIDEIPDPDIIKHFCEQKIIYTTKRNKSKIKTWYHSLPNLLHPSRFFARVSDILDEQGVCLEQSLYYYYMNCKSNGVWWGSVIVKYKNLKTPQYWRNMRDYIPKVRNAGWHFSYLGGIARIKEKMHSIIEGREEFASEEYITRCLDEGRDIYGRKGKEFMYNFVDREAVGVKGIDLFIQKYPYLYKES